MKKIPVHKLRNASHTLEIKIEDWNDPVLPDMPVFPHRHSFHELMFLLEGEATHEIDFMEYDFRPGSIHFIGSQCVHLLRRKPDSIGFSVMFSSAFAPQSINSHVIAFVQSSKTSLFEPNSEQLHAILELTQQLRDEYAADQPFTREILQSLLTAILFRLYRLTPVPVTEPTVKMRNPFAAKMEALIEQHYSENWKVSQYAEAFSTSVGNLSDLCKKHFSMSAQQLINERMLLEIKRLLVYTEKSVKEICYELNFEDASYFNRFFKKHVGITPLKYRNITKISE